MARLRKNIIQTIITQIASQFLAVVSGIFIARALGPDGRGVMAVYLAVVALCTTLFSFSIDAALIYFVANGKISIEKLKGLAFLVLIAGLVFTIVITSIFLVCDPGILYPKDNVTIRYIVWVWLCVFFMLANSIYAGFFQGIQRFDLVNKISLLNSSFNLALCGGCYLLAIFGVMKMGVSEVMLITLCVYFANSMHWHFQFRKHFNYKINLHFSWGKDIKKFFSFIGIMHLSMFVNFFNGKLVIWVLAFYLDNFTIGIYTLAAGLTQMLTMISNPLANVLTPHMTSSDLKTRDSSFLSFSRINFAVILFVAVFGAAIAPWLLPLLYGKDFSSAVYPFWILLISAILVCQGRLFSSYMISSGTVHISLYATLVGFIVTLLGNFVLVKYFGMIGAAIANSLTSVAIFSVLLIVAISKYKLPVGKMFIISSEDFRQGIAVIKGKLRRKV